MSPPVSASPLLSSAGVASVCAALVAGLEASCASADWVQASAAKLTPSSVAVIIFDFDISDSPCFVLSCPRPPETKTAFAVQPDRRARKSGSDPTRKRPHALTVMKGDPDLTHIRPSPLEFRHPILLRRSGSHLGWSTSAQSCLLARDRREERIS